MLEATVNGERSYPVEITAEGTVVAGQLHTPDIYRSNARQFHCLHRQTGYTLELLEADYPRKTFTFKIQGQTVTVQLKDELDLMVEQLGMAQAAETVVREITAPMPGLIVGVAVAPGQEVRQGDSVLTLEAMKMENVIKSPVDGVVEAIHAQAGDSVDKNQRLVSFRDA